jgi:chromosome segregation ATPase
MFGAQQPPSARSESLELQQARAKLAQLELLLKQGKTILQDLRTQANAAIKERDDLRGQLDVLRLKLESAVAERSAIVAEKDTALAAAVAEKEAALAEKEAADAAREAAVAAKDAALADKEAAAVEGFVVIAEKDSAVAAAVAAKEAAIAEKEAAATERDAAITHLEDAVTQIRDINGQRDEMSLLLSELRADRDRIADELKSAESRRAALEEQLGSAAGDVEQLRADAERARTLAREIVEIYEAPSS